MPEYEQNAADVIFGDGVYPFVCVDAIEKESKSHDPMIELQLDCYNADQTEKVRVVDRLVFTKKGSWKIDSFRKATGEKFSENKTVSFVEDDCIDRHGKVQLKTTSYNGRSRNEVDYYIEPEPDDDDGNESGEVATLRTAGTAMAKRSRSRREER
jgi:hypothetical protein